MQRSPYLTASWHNFWKSKNILKIEKKSKEMSHFNSYNANNKIAVFSAEIEYISEDKWVTHLKYWKKITGITMKKIPFK